MNQIKDNIAEQHRWHNIRWFRRMAPVYDSVEIFVAHIREKTAQEIELPKDAKILDMACGTGSQSIAFAKHRFSVVGVDLSPDMLARAKKKIKKDYDVTFLCQDASNIPYQNDYFDLAIISFGLHDMPEEIGLAILKEMKRATKPNGKMIIIDYDRPSNAFSAFLGRAIAKIWEGKYYDHFLKVGLKFYLEKVGIESKEKANYFFGNVQKVTCQNPIKKS
ncbi:MAG: class I SAM-dependent methyltransferase [Candidatus Cloacimonetes bacterium]|nr:class I SAM-dependent methyltransferase [Candidatus Cloacimonadota bacterium]